MSALTLESGLPAPAWLMEIVRSLVGAGLSVSRGSRPAGWRSAAKTIERRRIHEHPPAPMPKNPLPVPTAPLITRPPIPNVYGRDFLLIYRVPDGSGARPRDIVVSRFGRVELTQQEVDLVQREILANHPNAEFLVLRQSTGMPSWGARWVTPEGGRIDPRWIERHKAWP